MRSGSKNRWEARRDGEWVEWGGDGEVRGRRKMEKVEDVRDMEEVERGKRRVGMRSQRL